MSEEEIEIAMNALAGYPTLTSAALADKVEKILSNYKAESERNGKRFAKESKRCIACMVKVSIEFTFDL